MWNKFSPCSASLLRTGLLSEGRPEPVLEALTLLNQFHDILPGSSVKRSLEDSKTQYEEILRTDRRNIEARCGLWRTGIPASGRSAGCVQSPVYGRRGGNDPVDSKCACILPKAGRCGISGAAGRKTEVICFGLTGFCPKGRGVFSVEPASARTRRKPS